MAAPHGTAGGGGKAGPEAGDTADNVSEDMTLEQPADLKSLMSYMPEQVLYVC